jgi:peroxiredoxin
MSVTESQKLKIESRKQKTVSRKQFFSKLQALCFVLCALCITCSSGKEDSNKDSDSWTVTVKGKVGFPQQGQIIIQEIKDGSFGWQDTIQLKSNYTFIKKVKVSEPGYYRINFYNKQNIDLILYKNDLEVNVDGNNASGFAEVKGSPDIEIIRKAQLMLQETDKLPEVVKLNEDFADASQRGDQQKMMQIQQQYMTLSNQTTKKVAEYIKAQPASLGVINLLQNGTLDREQYFDVYVAVADKLKKEWPNYSQAKTFIAEVEKLKKLAIGQPAPEISLPTPEGQVVKLSSMKGKYVLVDFWAKWCGPCRKENPNVVRAYNQFKDKGFTVFGVSLDRNREDWVKAIQEDGLTWTHVSDLKFWQSEAAKTYNVSSIPFSLLLDPNGVIIAKNLRGPALEAKLTEIFSAKK